MWNPYISYPSVRRYLDAIYISRLILFTLAYTIAGYIGLRWAAINGAGSPVWPAFGVALAGLILGGVRLWPAIFLGRLLAGLLSGSSQPAWAELVIAASNALSAGVSVKLLSEAGVSISSITTIKGMGRFLFLGGGVGSAVAALGVASSIAIAAGMDLLEWSKLYFGIWTANFVGGAVVATLILSWWSNPKPLDSRQAMQFLLLLTLSAFASYATFVLGAPGSIASWYLLPILVVVSLVLQVRGASSALFLVGSIAIWLTGRGLGPFVSIGEVRPLSTLLQFLAIATITVLMLAVAADERRATQRLEKQKRALERSEELARTRAEELQVILNAVPAGILVARDRECRQVYGNPSAQKLLGLPQADELVQADGTTPHSIGDFRIFDTLGESLRWKTQPLYRAAQGEIIGPGEETIKLPNGKDRTLYGSAVPLFGRGREPRGAVTTFIDITDRKEAEERERLLSREVDHRAKNLLAVVQAALRLTRADDVESFRAALSGRIESLARVHSVLTENRWQGAGLAKLVSDELLAYSGGLEHVIQITGPECALSPAQAQSLALLFHELATNCAKYGSLSVPKGSLDVSWIVEGAPNKRSIWLRWVESAGPRTSAPKQKGFGLSLIEATVESQLGGKLITNWTESGLQLTAYLSLDAFGSDGEKSGTQTASGAELKDYKFGRRRIFVLEDEPLIALQLRSVLEEWGYGVVGPAATTAEAFEILAESRPDAAVIDINLNNEKSTPVAEALMLADIPFAFCSGYGDNVGLPPRLRQVPRLTKPVTESELKRVIEGLLEGD